MTKEYIGINDAKGKQIFEGDVYFEEHEQNEGDIRIYYLVVWLPEWAMFTTLTMEEYTDYQDNGIDALDDVSRNTFILDKKEFASKHYKGNAVDNPELLSLTSDEPEYD